MEILEFFKFEGEQLSVRFRQVGESPAPGVTVHEYDFVGDDSRDLALIEITPGCETPVHRVNKGIKTLEIYVSGEGSITIARPNGNIKDMPWHPQWGKKVIEVRIGDLMQIHAAKKTALLFAEICWPKWDPTRFTIV